MADQTDLDETLGLDEETLNRPVGITYYGIEDITAIIADQVVVSHSTGLFTLYFYQMQFPPTPSKEMLQTLESVPARCVARIVLTPQLMQQFSMAITTNLDRYNKALMRQLHPETEKHSEEG